MAWTNRAIRLAVLGLSLLLAPAVGSASAGGSDGHGHGQAEPDGHAHDDGHGGGHGHDKAGFGFGSAAPQAEPDRTVEIVARDDMSFEPESVAIRAGETVRFVVRNVGDMQHSFTLGSPAYHRQHDQEMMSMPASDIASHMQDSSNGIVVQPGTTGELTWRFERGGPIRFACHIPGHYPAGMSGRIRLEAEPLAAVDQAQLEE